MDDWTFAHTVKSQDQDSSSQKEQQHTVPVPTSTSKYIMLVSGLQIGNPAQATTTSASTSTSTTVGKGNKAVGHSSAATVAAAIAHAKEVKQDISNKTHAATLAASELSAQLLIDFVSGRLGGQAADLDIASKIVRFVLFLLRM